MPLRRTVQEQCSPPGRVLSAFAVDDSVHWSHQYGHKQRLMHVFVETPFLLGFIRLRSSSSISIGPSLLPRGLLRSFLTQTHDHRRNSPPFLPTPASLSIFMYLSYSQPLIPSSWIRQWTYVRFHQHGRVEQHGMHLKIQRLHLSEGIPP